MNRSRFLSGLAAALLCACGGNEEPATPDASTIDAGPSLRTDVVINNETVCPGGWTTGPTAVNEPDANRIVVRAGCSDAIDEVELHYAPHAAPGETAPCIQATIQIADGAKAKCRINNQILMAPAGELTVGLDGTVRGECACVSEDGVSTGGVDFVLMLE